MASGGTTISHGGGLADRYAAALYDLADEQGALDQTVFEADPNLGKLIDGSADFRRLLESPLIDIKQGIAAARAVLEMENFSPIIVRFVCVIAANRRLGKLRGIVSAFASLVAEKRGVVTAQVSTAHGLSERAAGIGARAADRIRVWPGEHPRAGGPGLARRPGRSHRRPPL